MTFDDHDFRHCMGTFATGVAIATTKLGGQPYGVTVNSFASVSLRPPLVLFNLDKKSSCHDIFAKSDGFAINILAKKQIGLSRQFTTPFSVAWEDIKHNGDFPLLEGANSHITCDKYSMHEAGDHTIFVGKVIQLEKISDEEPLLYYKGKYTKIGKTIEE